MTSIGTEAPVAFTPTMIVFTGDQLRHPDDAAAVGEVRGGGAVGVDVSERRIANAEDLEMLVTAVEWAVTRQSAPTQLLARKLRIGFARAARYLGVLESLNVVSPPRGATARHVLAKPASLEDLVAIIRAGEIVIPSKTDVGLA